jgi:hypothetical protein
MQEVEVKFDYSDWHNVFYINRKLLCIDSYEKGEFTSTFVLEIGGETK